MSQVIKRRVPCSPPSAQGSDRVRPSGSDATIRAVLGTLAVALIVGACGGGGNSAPPAGSPPGAAPPPAGGPSPVSIPADCAQAPTNNAVAGGSEAPSQIGTTIDAYANCDSVYPGQKITFHLSDHAGSVASDRNASVSIVKIGSPDETVYTGAATMRKQSVPNDAWVNCCNWPSGLSLTIPMNWETGYYRVQFTSPSGGSSWLSFVVKNRTPSSLSNLVFQVPFDTSQMYSGWGGKSAYTFNSTGGVKAQELSRQRPSLDAAAENYILGVVPFVRWADSQGIALEFISGTDMHANPKALDPYKVFFTVGHDEYFSQPMRNQLDRHIDGGGHAAIFSGNTMWWRTELATDANGRSLGKLVGNRQSGTPTSNWFEFDKEARTIGATFFVGGFVNESTQPALASRPYTVYQPNHWAFTGTGLSVNSQFGSSERILRYESDGIDHTFVGGLPVPTGSDGAPANTDILALADLSGSDSPSESFAAGAFINLTGTGGPNAAMTAFTRPSGGIVFNGGTTDFYRPLPSCTGQGVTQKTECRIFKNVLTYLQNN